MHKAVTTLGAILLVGCGTDVPLGLQTSTLPGPTFSTSTSSLVSFSVFVGTIGPNGEIQNTTTQEFCESGNTVVFKSDGSIAADINWTRECSDVTTASGFYNGGTADVWTIQSDGKTDHIGHFSEANWQRLDFTGIPAGMKIRVTAYPNDNAMFDHWTYAGQTYYTSTVEAPAYDGDEFFGEFWMKP